ncbi:hypothetical protein PLESTM_000376400 [Pleodorina starrii]|nr:hypothetical protein PLESTM_000376400 [Pleodorina starrii]
MSRLRLRHRTAPSCQRLALPLICQPLTAQPRLGLSSTAPCSAHGVSIGIATVTTAAADAAEDDVPSIAQQPISDVSPSPVPLDPELKQLLQLLPPAVRSVLERRPDVEQLVEVVMDLGRPPSARFPHGDVDLSARPMTAEDLAQAVAQVGRFDGDNRAGINSTLHRISAIRNRAGRVVGLTCRVGRAVPGAAELVRDLVLAGHSVLLLGRPGVGKTTALREVCRIAADESRQRVVIVDTSNEIGGDGDVPHPSIGGARRMQVPRPEAQHAVMVEAVENHMPQVVVIDEISTLAECSAARTIAQRGVQLVATAHGGRLENVIKNPTLADLVGGIQSVTLGDEEARRRGVQKSVLERAAPPTFDVAVEMEERGRWRVHLDVGSAVDTILAGGEASGQVRLLDGTGRVTRANYMGTVRRTDGSGVTTTSEWWADEAGEREPLLWPLRQDVVGPSSSSTSSTSSSFSAGSRVPRPRAPGSSGTGASGPAKPSTSYTTAASTAARASAGASSVAVAAASLSAALRANGSAAASTSGGAGTWSTSSSVSSGGGAAADGREVSEHGGEMAAAPLPLPRLRAHLVMDDEAAARVRAVLGLLRREAYEAAVAAAGGGGGGGAVAAASSSGGSLEGSESLLIELVPDLDMADMVIGTKSKLRNTPKVRNAARKRDLPVYALTATSTSALLRNLCPLLGLDPLAVAEVVRAAAGGSRDDGSDSDTAAAEGPLLSSLEGESDDGEEGLAGSSSGSGGGGHRRSLELSAADDYAELLATTVRELRYAPLDRSYAQHVLSRFVEEMAAAESAAAGASSDINSSGAGAGPEPADSATAAVRASSLAAVAWACGFVKHRKKFVEASRGELRQLSEACGRRWGEFSGAELLRIAGGFAGMRLAPPSAEWLRGLTAAAAVALGSQAQESGAEGQRAMAQGGGGGGPSAGEGAGVGAASWGSRLSADEASRLQLAVSELELLWLEAERQQQQRLE